MTQLDFIIERLSGAIEPAEAVRRYSDAIREGDLYPAVMELARGGGDKEADRAAFHAGWALEYAYFDDREAFMPYMERFLEDFPKITNRSVHRHYTKMLFDMMARETVVMTGARAEQIAETCFDFLIDPEGKVAVKMWAMEILFALRTQVDWVDENLKESITQLMDGGSPGIVSKVRKMLKRL